MSKLEIVGYLGMAMVLFWAVPTGEVAPLWAVAYALGGMFVGIVVWVVVDERDTGETE